MRIFFDFEFIENGAEHPIIPISVGMVREDGKEYYAEFTLTDKERSLANAWVVKNVFNQLGKRVSKTLPRHAIAADIMDFVGSKPEFWAYYADYDWVILCSLYGSMVNKPDAWPMFCLDIRQYMYHLGLTPEYSVFQAIKNEYEHDALADARWNLEVFNTMLAMK